MVASASEAPSSCVRGTNSNMPLKSSTPPVNISYGRDAPIEYQSTPIGEKFPNGSSSRVSGGYGICSGISLNEP